jgi:hypothetical protein
MEGVSFAVRSPPRGYITAIAVLLSLAQYEGELRLRELLFLHAENSVRSPRC